MSASYVFDVYGGESHAEVIKIANTIASRYWGQYGYRVTSLHTRDGYRGGMETSVTTEAVD